MAKEQKKSGKFVSRLKKHYRMVIMNDESFEVKMSFKLNPLNLLFMISSMFVIYAIIIILLFKFTPAREMIFGRDIQSEMRRDFIEHQFAIDSMNIQLNYLEQYNSILLKALRGEVDTTRPFFSDDSQVIDSLDLDELSYQDSLLRAEYEAKRNYGILIGNDPDGFAFKKNYFFSPITGIVTRQFDIQSSHFGIDVVAREEASIKACLDGKVIFTGWTTEYGHIIALQHADNLISIYKHNAILFKKVGSFVHAGDVIAILGNSGELSDGPHLHFELWHDMVAIDPAIYIDFNK
jgi:murein DD-endopeptidase MepM/ murein hydrolase activator NlpD